MKIKSLKNATTIRDARPLNGYTSCLPPTRRANKREDSSETDAQFQARMRAETAAVAKAADEQLQEKPLDFSNMSDAELLRLEPIAKALRAHDWYYDFSDDGSVWRRGEAKRKEIDAMLDAISVTEARALWAMYAPPGFRMHLR